MGCCLLGEHVLCWDGVVEGVGALGTNGAGIVMDKAACLIGEAMETLLFTMPCCVFHRRDGRLDFRFKGRYGAAVGMVVGSIF